MGDKDITEKRLAEYEDVFADIVNVLLLDGNRLIAPNELTSAVLRSDYIATSGKLSEQERDIAKFWQQGRVHLALFGLENQTGVDADIPLRVIGYDGAAYRSEIDHDKKGEPKERYPVITLVLYFGYKQHWHNPRSLAECLNIPKVLRPYVSDYKINVFEVLIIISVIILCLPSVLLQEDVMVRSDQKIKVV